jgi:hypothetical protein
LIAPLNPRDRTLDRIAARRVHRDHLIPEGSVVLAAVSGGADSVALLRFLDAERSRVGRPASLAVGHVNHALRGQESDEERCGGRPIPAASDPPRAIPPRSRPRTSPAGSATRRSGGWRRSPELP